MESAFPEEFAKDRTTFEKLVRMEHYGYPTRLMNVTPKLMTALGMVRSEGYAPKADDGERNGYVHAYRVRESRSACKMSRDETLSDGFSRWGVGFARQSLQSIVKFGVKTLVDGGCYSIDEEAYEAEYLDLSAVDACLESGLAMRNVRNLEEREEARDERRQSRSARLRNMWAGGTLGGGVKGAIKGALTAETMNIGGGLLSDAVNKIGSRRSAAKTVSRIADLFPLFRCELADAIGQAVRDSLDGFVKSQNEHLGRNISGKWEALDPNKAEGIFGNLKNGAIPDAHREKAIAEMVCADPFNAEIYDWIYENAEALRPEVKRVSEYFCVSVDALGQEPDASAS